VGPRAGLDGRKISSGPPARSSVAIPTELPGPQCTTDRVKKVSNKVGLNRRVLLKADNAGRSKQLRSRYNDVVQAARELRKLENVKLGHLKDTVIYSFYIRDCESLF